MKKLCLTFVLLIFCVTLFLFPSAAFANSALREYYGASATGALLTGNCPVRVTSEKLVFNIADYPDRENFSLNDYKSTVSAEYTFYNPSEYDISMQLVFPFGQNPLYLKSGDYIKNVRGGVTVDGKEADTVLRATYGGDMFEVDDALAMIKDELTEPRKYGYDMPVYKTVYQFSVPNGQDGEVLARFDFDEDYVWCTDKEIYRYEYPSELDRIYLKVEDGEEITLYTFGEYDIALENKVSFCREVTSDGKRGAADLKYDKIDGCSIRKTDFSEITLRDVALTYYDESDGISVTDYLNAVTEHIDNHSITHYNGLEQFDVWKNLILWYQYDVNIQAGSSAVNRVTAPIYPTINFAYEPNKFEYTYLWSPAKKWAGFENLDVEINASVDCYLLDGNSSFEQTENGYKAHFDSLPSGELHFVLCPSDNPEYIKTASNYFWGIFAAIVIFLLVSAVVTVVFAIVVPIVITKNHRLNKRLQTVGENDVNSPGDTK